MFLQTSNAPYYQPVAHEKVISNKEFNSLEDSHNSGIIIQTESGTILAFQQKTNTIASFKEITLVDFRKTGPGRKAKGSGSIRIPGTNGFVPQSTYYQYNKYEQLFCRNNVNIKEDQFNRNQNPDGASSAMETMAKRLSQE